MSEAFANIFRDAARCNRDDPRRKGNVVYLDAGCELIVSGDIHGHRRNFAKILDYAGLNRPAGCILVLQEIIHGPVDPGSGHDRSAELLLRAARLKATHPESVIFLLSNHDAAQLTGNEITKNGVGQCKSFTEGMAYAFGEDWRKVSAAIDEFFESFAIAIRCANGTFISHSLPSPARMEAAGLEILDRPYRRQDLHRGGAVYEWLWGRGQSAEQLDGLAERLGVEFFVASHVHVESGYEMRAPRLLLITSDHDHGCVLRFSADSPLTADTAPGLVRPIVALTKT
ncbi:MAG: hypothetical protein SVT52_06340 [Planctomycetota bacterium]|nr:hypothetical protein [Planctomycetota bacterium]